MTIRAILLLTLLLSTFAAQAEAPRSRCQDPAPTAKPVTKNSAEACVMELTQQVLTKLQDKLKFQLVVKKVQYDWSAIDNHRPGGGSVYNFNAYVKEKRNLIYAGSIVVEMKATPTTLGRSTYTCKTMQHVLPPQKTYLELFYLGHRVLNEKGINSCYKPSI